MRYNVDLLAEKEEQYVNREIEITDRMNDPFLATRLNKYQRYAYDDLLQNLKKNPFLYNNEIQEIKIEYVDDFCFEYNHKPLSVGGLVISSDIKKSKKKKIIKSYFKKCEDDYNKDLTDKMVQMENLVNIAESFQPKKIRFRTFMFYLVLLMFLFLFNFTPEKLLTIKYIGPFLTNFKNIVTGNPILDNLRFFTVFQTLICLGYIIFYNIRTSILSRKYNNTFHMIGKLSNKVEKVSSKAFDKVITHYLKQIKLKDYRKYKCYKLKDVLDSEFQLDNIEKLNKDSINKMSKIKKMIAFSFGFRHFIYIVTLLLLIAYIVLMFVL